MEESRLVELILENTNNYYNGQPCVDDATFDLWIDQLRAINPEHKILTSVGWGYDLSKCNKKKYSHLSYCGGIGDKPKVDHNYQLPSNRVKTPKMDGGSVELQYVYGKLTRALTRGDGYYGFDCTSKLQYAQGVVLDLNGRFTGNIIGEYVLSSEDMDETDSISQRNIPNGFLGRDWTSEDECRRFSFVAYRIGRSNLKFSSRLEILDFLKEAGFLTVGYVLSSIEFDDARESLRVIGGKHYLVDGVVSECLEVITHESGSIEYIGTVAYKTINDQKSTTVERISWNLTRTGRLVPTAILKPIELSGANVSRALAHNAWNVQSSGIGVGAVVSTIRSGEVIPYIADIESPVEAQLPEVCPSCGAPLDWRGVDLVCNNPNCSGQNFSSLYHWFSNIGGTDNLGGALITAIIYCFDIGEIGDFYKQYNLDDLSRMDGIGQSKIKIARKAFDTLRTPHSLEQYLVAMNIPKVGWETAKRIASSTRIREEISSDYFSSEFEDELITLKGVDYPAKQNLIRYWGRIVDNYKYMVIADPVVTQTGTDSEDDRIKVCITGKLTSGTKSDFYKLYKDQIVEADVKSCDYLICNQDKNSGKLKDARRMGKPIVTESDFLEIIEKGE